MDDLKRIKLLEELGFSRIEAQVYYILLKKSPLTGYKIAGEIGKSNSHTYLALDNLVKKGAITLLEGKRSKEYVAIPIEQYLEMKIRDTLKHKEVITEAFSDFEPREDDNQIYHFTSIEQFKLKACEIINNAQHTVLADGETAELAMIRDELAAAAARGVNIIVESTSKEPIPGCHMVEAQALTTKNFNLDFSWLVLCTDAQKTMVSYITKTGELIDGLWISNSLLSDWFYNGMFYEVLHRYTINLFKSDMTKDKIFKKIQEFHKNYRYERKHV